MTTTIKRKIHALKIWPIYFDHVLSGNKKFELRDNTDRNFQVGDLLWLQEWDTVGKEYTGRDIKVEVTYMIPVAEKNSITGLDKNYVIMSIKPYTEVLTRGGSMMSGA